MRQAQPGAPVSVLGTLAVFGIVFGVIAIVEGLTRLSVVLFMRWMDRRRKVPR